MTAPVLYNQKADRAFRTAGYNKKSSRPFLKTRFAHISDQRSSGWSEPTLTSSTSVLSTSVNRPAFSVVDKNQAGPLMVPAYLNVRATGGAVASFPYRGRPWMGWMFLCFFLCAKESKKPLLVLFRKEQPSKVNIRL